VTVATDTAKLKGQLAIVVEAVLHGLGGGGHVKPLEEVLAELRAPARKRAVK